MGGSGKAFFNLLSHHLVEDPEENHEKP